MMRWRTYSSYLEERFHKRIFRIGIDGGFSCPNRVGRNGGCTFCDRSGSVAVYQRKGEGCFHHDSPFDPEVSSRFASTPPVREQIERGKAFLKERYKAEGFSLYFQSFTNTYAPLDVLERKYDEALSYGPFAEFIVSTRPDTVPDDVLDLLASYKTENMDVWVELGLQSANDNTLKRINRGHGVDAYIDASRRIKEHGLLLSTHVILGLPDEGDDDFIHTAEVLDDVKTDAVKIHNLQILGGTEMEAEYRRGEIKLLSPDEYMDALILFLRHLSSKVIVGRLIGESPMHRLLAPRDFPDKSAFISRLCKKMEEENYFQGDLYDA